MSKHLPILIILLLAASMRLVSLGDVGWGIQADESLYGYEGMFISQTGTDHRQTGHPPLYLHGQSKTWDNRTSILYPYILAGLFTFLPPTMFVERLPAALVSIAIIFLVYVLARELWPNRRSIAIAAAALTTLSPVAFFWGRVGHDVIFLPFFTLLILWTILRTRGNPRWWFAVTSAGALSLYSYQPLKLVAPLIAALGIWYVWPTCRRQLKAVLAATVTGAILAAPLIVTQILHWHEVQGEFSKISLIGHPEEWWRIPGELWFFFTSHYLLSYRVVFPFLLPLGLVGLWLMRKTHRRTIIFLIGWVGIALLPAMLTKLHGEGIDLQWRSFGVLGSFEIASSLTLVALIEHLRDAKILRGLPAIFSAALVIVSLIPVVAVTWLISGGGEKFCCMNYGRLEQAIELIERPQWRERPVVFQLALYTLPDYVLWMTKYPPSDFLRGPVQWSTFEYPGLGPAELPTKFGRYTFCDIANCPQAPPGALYVTPTEVPIQGKTLLTMGVYAPQGMMIYPWYWKVVDSTLSP